MTRRTKAWAALALTALASLALPQSSDPAFEVASIRPVEPNTLAVQDTQVSGSGRVRITDMTLQDLIRIAFKLAYWQIDDRGSDTAWIAKDHYNVEAEPPSPADGKPYDERHGFYTIEDPALRAMLQTLLKDRFALRYHVDHRQAAIYVLERSRKPLRLVPSRYRYSDGFSPIGVVAGVGVQVNGMSVAELADFLGDYFVHRKVVDQTGLTGIYDFKSTAMVDSSDIVDPNEAVLSAVQEMGLQLRPSRGEVETLVLDHAQRPSPN
jgi:uncharacterized protein (TIGR03435 family)